MTKTIFKISMSDGNMTLVKAVTAAHAEIMARKEWGEDHGSYSATIAAPEDIEYAVGLGCIIHEFKDPVAFVPAPKAKVSERKEILHDVVVQKWKRVERALQLGPADTVTYHLSRADRDAFVSRHWANMPRYPKGAAPEYLSPDGEPETKLVPNDLYQAIESTTYGLRLPL